MNKYRSAAAAFKIDGYYLDKSNIGFAIAKSELIDNLMDDIGTIKLMSYDEFLNWKQADFDPEKKNELQDRQQRGR